MHFVYILQSEKDGRLYIGFTDDIKRRPREHNEGKSLATRPFRPYKLIYYEAFLERKDAEAREKFLKSGWGRRSIKKMLKFYSGVQSQPARHLPLIKVHGFNPRYAIDRHVWLYSDGESRKYLEVIGSSNERLLRKNW